MVISNLNISRIKDFDRFSREIVAFIKAYEKRVKS
jgi:predicted component of type VI protein secretion system